MNIKIEEAKPEHTEELQELFYKTWLDTYPNTEAGITVDDIEDRYKERHSPERLEKRRADIQNLDPNNKLLVALDNGHVIAMVRGTKDVVENKLTALYVLPEYQGKGVGKALWSEILKFFDPTKDVVTSVAIYNKKAIAFYEKLGFVDTGRRYAEERFRMKSGSLISEMDMVLKKD
jgi:ribosomal protein S18 acetylase RimI-like enzyme